jgi:hypothetical protein
MAERRGLRPRWAPRVPQQQIRRLYESEARGILDAELIDDVGLTLFLRCRSMQTVSDVMLRGLVPCPLCGAVLRRPPHMRDVPAEMLSCACGWQLPWGEYHATFRHQELIGADANPFVAEYVRAWPAARTPRAKLLLIDRLIHCWHWEELAAEHGVGRPTGVNFIEGGRAAVLALLDGLARGDQAAPELQARHAAWRARWDEVRTAQERWRERRRSRE